MFTNSTKQFAPLLILALLGAVSLSAQTGSVGIGTTNPDASAILEVQSSSQGVLLPRIAGSGIIASPAQGLVYYDTQYGTFRYNDGGFRSVLSRNGNAVDLTFGGNASVSPYLDFGASGTSANTGTAGWRLRLLGSGAPGGGSYGLGVDANDLWYAVPDNKNHIWKAGSTEVMTLNGFGDLYLNRNLTVNGGVLAEGGVPGPVGNNTAGYAFSGANGDNDSGMYSTADGVVSLYANAIERVRVDGANSRVIIKDNVTVENSLTVDNNLTVKDNVTVEDNLTVQNNLAIQGTMTAGGQTPIQFVRVQNQGTAVGGSFFEFVFTNYPASDWNAAIVGISTIGSQIAPSITLAQMEVTSNQNWQLNWFGAPSDIIDVMFVRREISSRVGY